MGYASIRENVLRKMEEHMPEIRERFGVKRLALFGSVSHAEDTPDSDVDILYEFLRERLRLPIWWVSVTIWKRYFTGKWILLRCVP